MWQMRVARADRLRAKVAAAVAAFEAQHDGPQAWDALAEVCMLRRQYEEARAEACGRLTSR
jgi:hypothetical protein